MYVCMYVVWESHSEELGRCAWLSAVCLCVFEHLYVGTVSMLMYIYSTHALVDYIISCKHISTYTYVHIHTRTPQNLRLKTKKKRRETYGERGEKALRPKDTRILLGGFGEQASQGGPDHTTGAPVYAYVCMYVCMYVCVCW